MSRCVKVKKLSYLRKNCTVLRLCVSGVSFVLSFTKPLPKYVQLYLKLFVKVCRLHQENQVNKFIKKTLNNVLLIVLSFRDFPSVKNCTIDGGISDRQARVRRALVISSNGIVSLSWPITKYADALLSALISSFTFLFGLILTFFFQLLFC